MYGNGGGADDLPEKSRIGAKIQHNLSSVYGDLRGGFSHRGADAYGDGYLRLEICAGIYAGFSRERDNRRRFYWNMRYADNKKAAEKADEADKKSNVKLLRPRFRRKRNFKNKRHGAA